MGRLLPGIEHRVLPVPGITRGGVLHVRGPNLMSGYYLYGDPGVLQPPQSEAGPGWYNTGDIVELDDDGFVTIHGRVKRFIKIAGEMVSLEAVESIAHHASPHHVHAATVELIQRSGESTVLFTTDPGLNRPLLQKAARELGAQELAVARRVVHVRELPLLGSGKTDYVELRTRVMGDEDRRSAEQGPRMGMRPRSVAHASLIVRSLQALAAVRDVVLRRFAGYDRLVRHGRRPQPFRRIPWQRAQHQQRLSNHRDRRHEQDFLGGRGAQRRARRRAGRCATCASRR